MATMGTTIDTLQVNITANAQTATNALKSLAAALNRVKTALTGMKDGATVSSHLSSSLNEMNGALNNINTGSIKKLQKLATALDTYTSAVKNLKSTRGGITASIRDAERALGIKSGSARSKGGRSKVKDGIDPNDPDTYTVDDPVDAKWTKVKQKASMIKGFLKTIGRIALYRAIRSAIKAVSQAFDEGLHNAYYFSKQTGDLSKLAETLDRIKSVTSQMVNQLGSFWGELIQFAAPALEWIANKVREIVEYLTEFFAAMNGDTQWKRAVYVEKSWDDATDKLKEYKHQLLGLDELNNLSKNKDSDKVQQIKDALDDFEYVDVSDKMKGLAGSIQPILKMIQNAIQTIWGIITSPIGLLVGGAILTFFSSHKLVGIAMMAIGAIKLYQRAKEDPNGLYNEIQGYMEKYRWLFVAGAIGLTVAGAALLFTGHYALGIGCLLSGGLLMGFTIAMAKDKLYEDIEGFMDKYKWLFVAGAIGLTTIGAALLFTGHYALGLGCVLGGVAIGATAIAISWEQMYNDIEEHMQKYWELFAVGAVGLVVAGCLLLFTEQYVLGISCLIAGGALGVATVKFNWDAILDSLKAAWNEIKLWFLNNVKGPIAETANWIETTLMLDLNRDGRLGGMQTKYTMEDVVGYTISKNTVGVGTKMPAGTTLTQSYLSQIDSETAKQIEAEVKKAAHLTQDYTWSLPATSKPMPNPEYEYKYVGSPTVNMMLEDAKDSALGEIIGFIGDLFGANGRVRGAVQVKAAGGIPSSGSMFIAGESGAEFVGNIGSTSAVANTGQMTDAIYKAAYMGMSKALKENGGGNMSGWEASTTDEIFAVMRKKASNYNKRTGNPAFA